MKKWISLLLAFCLLLPCAAVCENDVLNATDTAAETDGEDAAPTPYQVRKYFEQSLLPQLFYEDQDHFLDFINENGFFALWQNFTEGSGFDPVYSPEDFSQAMIQKEDGTRIILAVLPVPEDTPLCSRIYFCLNPESGKKGCYTVEYDNLFDEQWFLCGWTEDNVHMSYGATSALPAPADPGYEAALQAETDKVLELLNAGLQPEAAEAPSADGTGN